MKKKLCLLMALVCCVAVFAVAFAACNDNGGKSGNDSGNGGDATGGAGDVIFTEDASLEEIIAALENAESFTAEMKGSSSTVHGEETSSTVVDQIVMVSRNAIYQSVTRKWEDGVFREEYVTFVENDEVYFIAWSNKIYDVIVDAMAVTQQQKNLLSNTDPFDGGLIYIISLLLTEEDGKIVPDFDSPVDGTVYVRLEGDRLVIGMSYENDNEKETVEYVYSKVNTTDVVIPEEMKDLAADADWADRVSYNGVSYQKAEDEYGEYYRVSSVQYGAVPEETINTLPVRRQGEDPTAPEGDIVFTEDSSLTEIVAALENAESFTVEIKMSSSTAHGEETSSTVSEHIATVTVSRNAIYQSITRKSEDGIVREDYVSFVENGEVYFIAWSNQIYDETLDDYVFVDAMVVTQQQKDLLSNSKPIDGGDLIFYISAHLEEKDGEIVLKPEDRGDDPYLRLEGDMLAFGLKLLDPNTGSFESFECVYSKVNATDIVISDETKALAYEADWADSVSYNGVSYQKAKDEYGEYYRVSSVQYGAVPEETINTLPVREEGEAPAVPEGDVIFTEDASLEEIIAALENADSFTVEIKMSSSTAHGEETSSSVVDQIAMVSKNARYITVTYDGGIIREEWLDFIEGNESYCVGRSYENGTENETVVKMVKRKNLLSNTDPFDSELIYTISTLLMEEDGKIVPNPDVSPVDGAVVSVRLEGDRLVFALSYEQNDNEKATIEYVYSKVNATDIVISDETKALAYEADWADSVSYNGVRYQKAEDEYGEYYRVVSVEEGAAPEETINGLPVKER